MSLSNSDPRLAASAAKAASHSLAILSVANRNEALSLVHSSLSAAKDKILEANARDLANARAAGAGISESLISRLDLTKKGKWEDMLQGILDVRGLEDPVGKISMRTKLDDGLILERVSCPIGVLLIIFEARPEVIANIASLAIKSGNAAILKGGKESTESFVAISTVISEALAKSAVPNDAIQLVTTRDVIPQLLALDREIDLVVPRGGNDLVKYIKNNTRIPVLGHADGICSATVLADADKEMAAKVVVDGKTNYPAACNALETLLIQSSALESHLPTIAAGLVEKGVSLRCDAASLALLQKSIAADKLSASVPADYDTEFLALTIAVKVIEDVTESITHINQHGSHHTDIILTKDEAIAEKFMASVDSAGVYWNSSSRMADGMRYGFGTEVGISTNKIHSRGPVGLEGLMIYKYKIRGQGHIAGDYGAGKKAFKHETLPL